MPRQKLNCYREGSNTQHTGNALQSFKSPSLYQSTLDVFFFSRKYPKCTHSMACMWVGWKKIDDGKVLWFCDVEKVMGCRRRSVLQAQEFISIDHLTILFNSSLSLFHYAATFSSGPENSAKKAFNLRRRKIGTEWLTTSWVEKKKGRESFRLWLAGRRKNGRRIMKKRKKQKKNRPDGNCNNITLDQTHIHILNGWFWNFFLVARWCEDNRFSCWYFFFKSMEKGDFWPRQLNVMDVGWKLKGVKWKDGKANCRRKFYVRSSNFISFSRANQ